MPGKKKYTLGQVSDTVDLTLPSGATCSARRPGVEGLIAAGLLDSFDELTALVQTEHIAPNTAQGPRKPVSSNDVAAAAKTMGENKGMIHTALMMMDRLAAYVVVEPPVWVDYQIAASKDGETPGETDEEFAKRAAKAKEDGAVAVRAIELDDKMFLLQWAVGGSSDLTAFREGSKALMANLESGAAVQAKS